jgi:hypothetical protein
MTLPHYSIGSVILQEVVFKESVESTSYRFITRILHNPGSILKKSSDGFSALFGFAELFKQQAPSEGYVKGGHPEHDNKPPIYCLKPYLGVSKKGN